MLCMHSMFFYIFFATFLFLIPAALVGAELGSAFADRGGGVTVDADIGLALGEDVRMNGFGLNGTLAGQLRVRDRPGMPTTARGSIDVGGAYKAYGQDLSITRGRVAWAATPMRGSA